MIPCMYKKSQQCTFLYWSYEKNDNFDFSIVNFPSLCSSIPLSPAYGIYVSQLTRYAGEHFTYEQFLIRGKLLTNMVEQ